jgi:hypothetical protein
VDLATAVAYHQQALAAAGRSVSTRRKCRTFEELYMRYLERAHLPTSLGMLDPSHVLEAMLWYDHAIAGVGGVFVDVMHDFSRFLAHEGLLDGDPLDGFDPLEAQLTLPHTSNVNGFHCPRCEERAALAGAITTT